MNPQIKVSMSFLDWVLEILGALFIMATWYLLLANYWILPAQVPVHYDFWGNPNVYSGKQLLWLVPVLMTAVYIGINFLNKIPHLLNYPIPVTEANASKLYVINLRTLRIIRVLIAGQLLYGKIGLIGISNGELSKLSVFQMPVFLGCLALTIITSYLLMFRLKNIG
jgi:hypothetical protein